MNPDNSVGERIGLIVDEAMRIALASARMVAIYLAVMVAASVAVDATASSGGADFGITILSIAMGYFLTITMVGAVAPDPEGPDGGFGTYFGLSLLSGFAILAGLVLLVVPGVLLLIRLAPLYGFGLVNNDGVSAAFSESWAATKGHMAPIAVTLIIPTLMFVGSLGMYFYLSDGEGVISIPVSLVANTAMFSGTVLSTAIGLAIYSLLSGPGDRLEEIFA
ncbi:hypothetical protein [Parerythrobacter jejuensis]|uniref:Glycerophosphoryl diester phosphodiesterase membrane domain-containing protein n=1 Tax=Parerythrobacter jejuensis TaxID=795812 RepID=A0A845ASG6_9SPHN|nr:hypothetical protein [Parerythrobacter jejuensis]MXP32113.1 hypothetical protein [Parerythrobacter jejuensis]